MSISLGQLLTSALSPTTSPVLPSSLVGVQLTTQEISAIQAFLSASPDTLSSVNTLLNKYIKNGRLDTKDIPALVLEFIALIKKTFPKGAKVKPDKIVLVIQAIIKVVVNSPVLNLTPAERNAIIYAVEGSLDLAKLQISGKIPPPPVSPDAVKSTTAPKTKKSGFLAYIFSCGSSKSVVDPSANQPTEIVQPAASVAPPVVAVVQGPPAPKKLPLQFV